MLDARVRLEYASERKLRDRNKLRYRLAHWPIWIAVLYLMPGPVTFNLFAHGLDRGMGTWLASVMLVTGIAGWYGKLPGVEHRPYILRFTEDRPNPVYRRICYTIAWSELISYAVLNLAGLLWACFTGAWRMAQIYRTAYVPLAVIVCLIGAAGRLPRVKPSTKGEGDERRYFYGLVWAVPSAQGVLWLLWRTLPINPSTNWLKLAAFVAVLAVLGVLAVRGVLPRTRKIVPGEWAISD